MKHVVTLIGNPAVHALDMVTVDRAVTALARADARLGKTIWLAKRKAADIEFDGVQPRRAEQIVLKAIGEGHFDIFAQPVEGRRRKLLVADMDSTILAGETIDEIAAEVGKKAEVARITAEAMQGKLKYAESLKRRVALLAGLWADTLNGVLARLALNPGATTLVATMKKHGATTVLVSGGFTQFTGPVAKALGFDRVHANELEVVGGKLTGSVKEPILDAAGKRAILEKTAAELKIPLHDAIAVGDGANDLAMVEAAGIGVAYHAKPALAMMADAKIEHGDLTALLYLQGFRDDDLVVKEDRLGFAP